MQPIVSIIIPVYNTGMILKETVKSILEQTYPHFELLLIDDGSKEDTAQLCDEIQQTDNRIRVFHNQNAGICGARNFGLKYVQGEYVTFCDHDDLYMPLFLERLVNFAEQYNVDVIKCNYRVTFNQNGSTDRILCEATEVYDGSKLTSSILMLMRRNAIGTVWNGIYRTEVLKKCDILFNTEYKSGGEDIDYNIRLVQNIQSLCFITDILYIHIVRGWLSTSSKLYESILQNFIKEAKRLNDIVTICTDAENCKKEDYTFLYVGQVVSFLSYSARMHKDSKSIREGISELYRSFNRSQSIGSFSYLKKAKNKKEKKHFLTYLCLIYNKLELLYKVVLLLHLKR